MHAMSGVRGRVRTHMSPTDRGHTNHKRPPYATRRYRKPIANFPAAELLPLAQGTAPVQRAARKAELAPSKLQQTSQCASIAVSSGRQRERDRAKEEEQNSQVFDASNNSGVLHAIDGRSRCNTTQERVGSKSCITLISTSIQHSLHDHKFTFPVSSTTGNTSEVGHGPKSDVDALTAVFLTHSSSTFVDERRVPCHGDIDAGGAEIDESRMGNRWRSCAGIVGMLAK